MRPENYEVRKKLFRRFILLYLVSIALLIAGFRGLSSREPDGVTAPATGAPGVRGAASTSTAGAAATAPAAVAENATPAGSATGGRVPTGNVPTGATEKQQAEQLRSELDSVRREVLLLRREVLIKDSLIDQLAMAPVPEIYDHAFEKQEKKQRQKEKAAIRDALQKMR